MFQSVSVQVNCLKGRTIRREVPVGQGALEEDGFRMAVSERDAGGCLLGEISLDILQEDPLGERFNLALETPVRVFLPMKERPKKITAMYLYNPWWTRPAFADSFREIPPRTQIAFFQYEDRCGCLVPMVGKHFKSTLTAGTDTELCLEMTACVAGLNRLEEPLFLWSEAPTVTDAVHKAFAWLSQEKGILPREGRKLPEMFRYLGWCSWDALHTDVSEEKLREKADELAEKHIPIRWMLIDDGWMPVRDKMLTGFAPDKAKFPNGFRAMTEKIRAKAGIRWFGVWHALGGYWGGVDPDSPLAQRERPYLYRGSNGCLVPSPETGAGFYRDWCDLLRREGIDFLKVDGQSCAPFYFENCVPVAAAARGMNQALESGGYQMQGAIINCMGMAMENILARPTTALSRNSDDFLPDREESFAEHLIQNAWNSIYHNEIYVCDWDMFWTRHKHAAKHSLLRAVSGGPIYCSDKIGDTEPEVLRPLACSDGRILMMDRSAKPTEDCIFADPRIEGVLKLHNIAAGGSSGGIAAFNLTGMAQSSAFTPADIPDLQAADRYWVYDWFHGDIRSLGRDEAYAAELEADGFAWYVLVPQGKNGCCLGLLDKFAGIAAVESVREAKDSLSVVLRASGTVGWAADRAPRAVLVDGTDETEKIERSGHLYRLPLPETADQTVLTILW